MVISRKKQLNYVLNLNYPIIGNKVQIDLDDTDSITFSRFVSKKAVVMCANRLEYILANNPDNFDLDIELSNLYETLRFAEKNLKVAGGIEEWNGNTAWVCVNSFGMELMFASKPHKVDDSWRGDLSDYLKNRDNLEYFTRSYKDSAYHNIMEWLDKKK